MKHQDSISVKAEIDTLKQKRLRLQADLEAAQRAHEESRAAVVHTGDAQSLDEIASTHSRAAALADTVTRLDIEIEKQEERLKSVVAAEQRENWRVEITAKEKAREQARVDYLSARERANAALQSPIAAMVEARQKFGRAGRDIERLSEALGHPHTRSMDKVSTPRLEPFGFEVDQAYTRAVNMAQKEEAERSRQQQREREQVRRGRTPQAA